MGTSTDATGPTGGNWSQVRSNATRYAKTGDRKYARRALARHVSALGGAAAAAEGAAVSRAAAQRLGSFAVAVSGSGLDQALHAIGLAHLTGRDRFEVLDALATYIAGDGSQSDDAAARDAAIAALNAMFGEDATDYEDLDDVGLDAETVENLLVFMLAEQIYGRVAQTMHERIARQNVANEVELENQIKDIIRQHISLDLGSTSPLDVDWAGPQGEQILDGALATAYRILGDGQ